MADPERVEGVQRERRAGGARDAGPELAMVRDEDLEPHAGLRYVARLFKLLAVLLILLLIGEVAINLARRGGEAVPFLLVEATRLIVFAGLLWGAADIALMLIESNHDLRATRILVGRMGARVQAIEQRMSGVEAALPPMRGPAGPANTPPPIVVEDELPPER